MATYEQPRPDIAKLKKKKDIQGLIEAGVYKLDSGDRWDAEIRNSATSALRQMGTNAVEPLVQALKSEDENVRRFAIGFLENIGGWRAVEPLVALLSDEDANARNAAAQALATIGSPAIDPLSLALTNNSEVVRRLAIAALAGINDPRVVGQLIGALADQDAIVRRQAANALGNTMNLQAVEPFVKSLFDSDSEVRHFAAEGLGRLGDKRAIVPLVNILGDDNSILRETAATALEGFGEAAIAPLAEALKSEDSCKRLATVGLLARMSSAETVPLLVGGLNDKVPEIGLMAAKTLGEKGDSRSVDSLAAHLRDAEPMSLIAAVALVKIGKQPEASMAEDRLKQTQTGRLHLLDALEMWETVGNAKTAEGRMVLGVCSKCGKTVFGLTDEHKVAWPVTGRLEPAPSSARFCLKCKNLFCYSCGRDDATVERCPKCWTSKSRGFVNPIQFLKDNGEML